MSLDSSELLYVVQSEQIGYIGNPEVNGGDAPYLLGQVICDLQGFKGVYLGVASKIDFEFYMVNYPNSMMLLKYLKSSLECKVCLSL